MKLKILTIVIYSYVETLSSIIRKTAEVQPHQIVKILHLVVHIFYQNLLTKLYMLSLNCLKVVNKIYLPTCMQRHM